MGFFGYFIYPYFLFWRFGMTLEEACSVLKLTKGQIVKIIFDNPEKRKSLDYALPQSWIENNLKAFNKNRFWLLSDCSTIFPEVIDMRNFISPFKRDKLIELACLHEMVVNKNVKVHSSMLSRVLEIEKSIGLCWN